MPTNIEPKQLSEERLEQINKMGFEPYTSTIRDELMSHIAFQKEHFADCSRLQLIGFKGERDYLESKLLLAQKDTERLDWLEKEQLMADDNQCEISGPVYLSSRKDVEDVREAIDFAIAATNDHPSYVAQTDSEAKKSINKQVDPNEDGRVGL